MPSPPYPPEYGQLIVELVRASRRPEELAREFEPTAQTIQNCVRQPDGEEGRCHDGPTTAERQELAQLRRDLRQAASRGMGHLGKSRRLDGQSTRRKTHVGAAEHARSIDRRRRPRGR